jgi:hypothetical protein
MTNPSMQLKLPPQWLDAQDKLFFKLHPERRAHIRKSLGAESEAEFRTLGDHERNRRRILLWRVPETNPFFERLKQTQGGVPILKVPFLQFADETIEDEDAVLLPILDEIMRNAAQ